MAQLVLNDLDENKAGDSIYQDYLKWAEENVEAIYHYPLNIKSSSDGERAVYSEEKVNADTIVFSIPYEGLLSFKRVAGTPLEAMLTELSPLREEDILALLLLFEKDKGAESQWSGHIELLPNEYHNVLYFTDEEVQDLQGSNLYIIAQKLKTQVVAEYEEFSSKTVPEGKTIAEKFPWFTLEAYKWALCTIWSRFVSIVCRGEQLKVMAPVFDMFNHDPGAAVMHGFQDLNNCLHIVTFQDWTPGNEISINYGPIPNSSLLQLYGFVILDNPFDSVKLWATMSPDCPDFTIKKQVLDKNEIKDEPFLLTRGKLDPKLLGTLRVQRANDDELASVHCAFEEPLSIRNESEVLDVLENAINSMLEGYCTSIEEDETIIKAWKEAGDNYMKDKSHQKMAVILRYGEKQILQTSLSKIQERRQCIGRVVVLISHAAVQRKMVGNIISKIESRGFKLCGLQTVSSDKMPEKHPFVEISQTTPSGPMLATLWDGKDCLAIIPDIIGCGDAHQMSPASVNRALSVDSQQPICYASADAESALVDSNKWFLEVDFPEIAEWKRHSQEWVEENV
mmetsp:Transcript_28499/g.37278  ORF Transcript_28499/g.37278 Transcript_28499/m.37278 type:complete len:566 (+) Transcript_28499:23-1720(+)